MEKEIEISVSEFIKTFVAISYYQEARVFNFTQIFSYIYWCHEHSNKEYQLDDLIKEAEDTLEELINDGTLSLLYSEDSHKLYRVNVKKDFIELSKYPKKYLDEMNKAFLYIHGGELTILKLVLSKTKQK